MSDLSQMNRLYQANKLEPNKTVETYDLIWVRGFYINKEEARNITLDFLNNLSYSQRKEIMFNYHRWEEITSYDLELKEKFNSLRKPWYRESTPFIEAKPIHLVCYSDRPGYENYYLNFFKEMVDAFYYFFDSQGLTPSFSFTSRTDSINIYFNYYRISNETLIYPNSIAVNFESFTILQKEARNFEIYNQVELWDYSSDNLRFLNSKPRNKPTKLLKIGFSPEYKIGINLNNGYICDVLFIGFVTPVRTKILDELIAKKINVKIVNNLWDPQEKANLYCKSKILLNLHSQDITTFEFVRVIPAIAAGAFVISEKSSNYQDSRFIENGLVFSNYQDIVETVEYYLMKEHEKERESIRNFGRELLKLTPFSIIDL